MSLTNPAELVFILMTCSMLPAAQAQCGAPCDTVTAWRSTLFNGISTVEGSRFAWNRLLTFKDTAHVVMKGITHDDALVALATLGGGRIAAVGNTRHVEKIASGSEKKDGIKRLHDNLKIWLKNGDTGPWDICEPRNSSHLITCLADPNVRTLVYVGGTWPTGADNDAVASWIKAGNTLVHGFTTATFEAETVESAKKIGFYECLLEAGIAYDPTKAATPKLIPPEANVTELVNLNLKTVAASLTWENFESNEKLSYVLALVSEQPRYFLAEVSKHVLQPFEAFAVNMETNMIPWPQPTQPCENVTVTQYAMYAVYRGLSMAQLWREKAPAVDSFPGDIPDDDRPPSQTVSFSLESKTFKHTFPTDHYLLPGQIMTLTVTNPPNDDTWMNFEVRISAYTDRLKLDSGKGPEFQRFPEIKLDVALVDREMSIRWPFGGLVSIRAPSTLNSSLDITISGVIETPYLDIIEDQGQDFDLLWAERCQNRKGFSADIRGQYTRFTVPISGGVCDGTYTGQQLKETMHTWDRIVLKDYELLGRAQDSRNRQTFTCDIQTTAGILHSGDPIVGKWVFGQIQESAFYLNGIWDKWGPYHELGHNYDQKWYLYPEVRETVPNIWSFFNMERMAGYTWYTLPKIQDIISTKLLRWLKEPTWENTTYNNLVRLLAYTQVIRDFGWGCQRDIFKSYNDDFAAGNPLPKTNDEVIQEWVRRWSEKTQHNLCPFFRDFWKWPVSAVTCDALGGLPAYLPDDTITQLPEAAGLEAYVLSLWPNLVRTVNTTAPTCDPFDIHAN